jgi:predicted lipid-binding transport protein (Tim44 family)
VNQHEVSPTGLSERAPAHLEEPPGPNAAPSGTSGWTGGRIASLVIGTLLVLVSLGLLGSGGTALWVYLTQRDAGYVTTGVHRFSAAGSPLARPATSIATSRA